jgi:hypothetical protein
MTKYTVFLATCTPSMDTINVYLGLFSVHYQLKINFKADLHLFYKKVSHENYNIIVVYRNYISNPCVTLVL